MKKRKGTGGAEGKAAGTILVLNNLAFEASLKMQNTKSAVLKR